MPRAEDGIFVGDTDTPSIYKVHIPACSHIFIMSTLDVKFESMTADSCPEVEVTMSEVTTADKTMLDVNSDNGLTSTILISFTRPTTHSMADS